VNTGAPWPGLDEAEARVLEIQAKLHQWAKVAPNRRFDDLYNLVYDPAILMVAWSRVRTNRGARSAGVDKVEPRSIVSPLERFLPLLREQLKARQFVPLPVRERYIPKGNGKTRRLGIATARDRTVQAALKLILEPIFEADFRSFSYGFRPGRRAQDAIAEIYNFAINSYEWVLEADITACFDEISHSGLMDRVRRRVGDKRVLALVKRSSKPAFSVRMASRGIPPPAHPKAASSRRCWPTSPFRSSTITSPRPGRVSAGTAHPGASDVRGACPRIDSSAMRTTSSCSWLAPAVTPSSSGPRLPLFSHRWAFAYQTRRRGSATSTRASTSLAGASSVKPGGARRTSDSSTPGRPGRHSPPSRPGCGRSLDRARTTRSPISCISST